MNKLLSQSIVIILLLVFYGGVQAGDMRITVQSAPYTIEKTDAGHKITMANSGYLQVPGKPYLPAQKLMIALPPGTRAISANVVGKEPIQLTGTYTIIPSPRIIPIADLPEREIMIKELNREWQENNITAYGSNQYYPAQQGELTGRGTLRKYSYGAVAFYPFSYNPASGALVHYNSAEITIHYEEPVQGSAEALRVEEILFDTVADEKAASLFMNFNEMKHLYQPRTSRNEPNDVYDIVILTSTPLVDSILNSNYPAWKISQGHTIRIVLVSIAEMRNQFFDGPQNIRYYLRNNYIPWSTEYVLIVGDFATVPMRYCYPNPANHTHNPYDPLNPGGSVPTDYYYADLSYLDEASWDLDGDGFYGEYSQDTPDFLAEVAVGRISTSDTARITYTLNKLVAFEQTTDAWKQNALHAGAIISFANQDNNGLPVVDGAVLPAAIETDIMSGWTIQHYSEAGGIAPSTYPWLPLTEAAFTSAWRNGQFGVVNWGGHGLPANVYRFTWDWDDGDGVPETDGSDGMTMPPFIGLTSTLEDDHPSILCAVSCKICYPDNNSMGFLGINMLTQPGWGTSAGLACSTRSAAVDPYWSTSHAGAMCYCYEFNSRMINAGMELADALYDAKYYCHQNYAWAHYLEYQNLFDYQFYGDPAMIYTMPSSAPPPVPNGSGTTTPMLVNKLSATQLQISWDSNSCPATEYNLIYGDIANVSAYTIDGSKCTLLSNGGNPNTWSTVPAGSIYILMVGTNGNTIESSWGTDSQGVERNGTTPSAQCTVTTKDTSLTCP